MGLTHAEMGVWGQNHSELEWSHQKMGTALRGSANLSEQLWRFLCLIPFEKEMLGRVMSYGLFFPRLEKPDNCCRIVKVGLNFEASPLWNSTFLCCLERNRGFPVLESTSFVLHHHVSKYWSECDALAFRSMKSKGGLKWWMQVRCGERKLLWEDGAQTVKDTVVKLGRLVFKSMGQLAYL